MVTVCARGFALLGAQVAALPRSTDPAADEALAELHERIRRLQEAGGVGDRTLQEATWQFHSMGEGLAAMDLRPGMSGLTDSTAGRTL